MKNWHSILINTKSSMRDAMNAIENAGTQLALIIDENSHLMGTLSDGDIRRALLNGATLDDNVIGFMNSPVTTVNNSTTRLEILQIMRQTGLNQIPIVDSGGAVVGLSLISEFINLKSRDNWVIVMAGGLGTRLKELTHDTPKPMLKVGSRPLLENIIRNLRDQGFKHFYLAVNYMAEQIQAHFGDGSELGVEIRYLRENKRMGTAGALSLLPEYPTSPIVVTNADLLTTFDFGILIDRHVSEGSHVTMAVRDYEMQVPFGVVNVLDGRIQSIKEKPTKNFMISAGINVLSPEVLNLITEKEYLDMPTLLEKVIDCGMSVKPHQIEGYWLDIGRKSDFERANIEFNEVFND